MLPTQFNHFGDLNSLKNFTVKRLHDDTRVSDIAQPSAESTNLLIQCCDLPGFALAS